MRIMIFIILLLILISSVWVSLTAERYFLIEWFNYHIEISTIFATILVALSLAVCFLIIYFIIFLKNIPDSLKKHYKDKQDHDDLLLLLNGFASLYTDDLAQIKPILKKVNSCCNHQQMQLLKPVAALFVAQSNRLQYQTDVNYAIALEDSYQELLQYEATRMIALKGLITLRIEKKCYHDALVYAEKAFAIQPKSQCLLNNLREIYTALDLYEKTHQMIDRLLDYKFLSKKEADNLFINNFINHAKHLIINLEISKAIILLEKALKINSAYYEALVILVRLYVQDSNKKLAYKIIEKAWKNEPSMDIAHLMLTTSCGEAISKKVRLLENLIDLRPDHKGGYFVLTELYIEEDILVEARKIMDKFLSVHAPDSQACKLMALIEAKTHNNHSIIINWLRKL